MNSIIETDRLLLREVSLDDKEDMLLLHSHAEVQKYTGEALIKSMEEMEKAIIKRTKDHKKYGYGRWATFLKKDMKFIGWAGLAYLPEFDEIDLGYRFFPEYWGNGYATEAARSILIYGFDVLNLNKIIAIAMKENKASIRVMEKAGMQFYKFAPYDPGGEDVVWYTCDKNLFKDPVRS